MRLPQPRHHTAEVIEELISLAKELDAAARRGEDLGLSDDEGRLLRRPRCQRQRR